MKWFNLESSSMTRILLCTDYPNLYALGLIYIIFIKKKKNNSFLVRYFSFVKINSRINKSVFISIILSIIEFSNLFISYQDEYSSNKDLNDDTE